MQQTPEIWEATYKAKNVEELAEAYQQWAPRYDKDTRDAMGYVAPQVASTMLDKHLESKRSTILDAGCGTGQVGEALKEMGYQDLHATDYSRDMLCRAQDKGVYSHHFQADMNEGLGVPDDTYDASICVGTFTYAHVGPHVFDELLRITRPGGVVCFTIRDGAYQKYNYREKMVDLETARAWELQEMIDTDYLVKEQVTAKFCTYKVLDA